MLRLPSRYCFVAGLFALSLVLAIPVAPLTAQTSIQEVLVEGNERIEAETVRSY